MIRPTLTGTWRGQFIVLLWSVLTVTVLLAVMTAWCLARTAGVYRILTQEAAPNLDAVARMSQALQRLDALSAEALRGTAGLHSIQSAEADFRSNLFEARRHSTDDSQRQRLDEVEGAFVEYVANLSVQFYEQDRQHPTEAQTAWLAANQLLHDQILPGLARLLGTDAETLHQVYQQPGLWWLDRLYAACWLLLSGLMLIGAVLMAWRTHRIINIGLAIGALLVLVVGGEGLSCLTSAYEGLAEGSHAYQGILSVDQIRCSAIETFCSLSRQLTVPREKERADSAFDMAAAVVQVKTPEVVGAWSTWLQFDTRARHQMEKMGSAIEVFEQFDHTLSRLEDENRSQLETRNSEALHNMERLQSWYWLPLLVGLAAGVLGIRSRLSEF